MDKVNEYNQHISKYEYTQKRQEVINRGVVFVPQSKPSTIKANWSKLFAASVTSDEKKEIRYENYKWHIFSFEKVNALSNSKARQSFNKCKKEKVYVFYQHKDKAFFIENAQQLKSTDFDSKYLKKVTFYIFTISQTLHGYRLNHFRFQLFYKSIQYFNAFITKFLFS